jgi:PadR family transcriptional regulator PadR
MDVLTRIEEAILLAVVRLDDNAYGVTIRQEVAAMVGKSYSIGAIYGPLDRLAGRGLLETRMGEATPERGGRRKRFYEVTSAGLKALRETKSLHEAMWSGTLALGNT